MSFLWRKNKSNLLTNYGNPSPTDQDTDIDSGFAQNLKTVVQIFMEKTSLCAFLTRRLSAGMTVEAAVALPVFLFCLLNLSCAIEMIRLHGNIQMALWETGQRLTVYGHVLGSEESLRAVDSEEEGRWWEGMAGIAFSYGYIRNQLIDYLGEEYLDGAPLSHGTEGLQFWESKILQQNDEMEIILTYGVSPWGGVAVFCPFRMANRYHAHIWNGYDILGNRGEEKEELVTVYVTETGEVYHRDRNCTHLCLSIREITAGTEGNYRNEKGGKYSECVICRKDTATNILYITREGDSFHYNRECSGLKRTIYAVLLKDAEGYRPCSRCSREM